MFELVVCLRPDSFSCPVKSAFKMAPRSTTARTLWRQVLIQLNLIYIYTYVYIYMYNIHCIFIVAETGNKANTRLDLVSWSKGGSLA